MNKRIEIEEKLISGTLTENEVSEYRNYCAGWLSRFNAQFGELLAQRAVWETQKREEYKSQAETERAWEATESGQEMVTIKYRIRSLEALSDALHTNWFLLQREWKETAKMEG